MSGAVMSPVRELTPVESADWILSCAVAESVRIYRSGAGTGFYRRRRVELLLEREQGRAAAVLAGFGGGGA